MRFRVSEILAAYVLSACALSACPVSWEIAPSKTMEDVREEDFAPARVPGYREGPSSGYAVYRARFGCDTNGLTLEISESSSAAMAYAGKRLLAASGRPAVTAAGERPRLAAWFVPLNGEKEILIFVSNHHARSLGILGARTGRMEDLLREHWRSLWIESGIAGFLLACGVFFLILYRVEKDPAYLPFALLMFVSAVRSIASNSILEEMWPQVTWARLRLLLEYQTAVAWMPPLFFLVVYFLFANESTGRVAEFRSRVARFTAWIYAPAGLLLSVFFAVSYDASFYGRFQPYYVFVYLLPGLALCTLLLILFVMEKQKGAGLLLAGFFCVLAATLFDAEKTVRGQGGLLLVPAGLTVFALCFLVVAGGRLRTSRASAAQISLFGRLRQELESRQNDDARTRSLVHVKAAMAHLEEDENAPALLRLSRARRILEPESDQGIVDLSPIFSPEHPPVLAAANRIAALNLARELAEQGLWPVEIETGPRIVLRARADGPADDAMEILSALAGSAGASLAISDGLMELSFLPVSGKSLPLEERHERFLSEAAASPTQAT